MRDPSARSLSYFERVLNKAEKFRTLEHRAITHKAFNVSPNWRTGFIIRLRLDSHGESFGSLERAKTIPTSFFFALAVAANVSSRRICPTRPFLEKTEPAKLNSIFERFRGNAKQFSCVAAALRRLRIE